MALQVLAVGDEKMLCRPCVDCGTRTGRFCDGHGKGECYAANRLPDQEWADGQLTPLCRKCEDKWRMCHWCRRAPWCEVPPPVTKEGDKGKGKGKNKDAPTNFWEQPWRARAPSYSDTDEEDGRSCEASKGGKGNKGKGAPSNEDKGYRIPGERKLISLNRWIEDKRNGGAADGRRGPLQKLPQTDAAR